MFPVNRRLRAVRSAVALSAEVSRTDNRRSEPFSRVVNLSGSGALLETDREMEEGELVRLRFSLPGVAMVEAEARVARIVGSGQVGVTFERLDDRTAEMIVRHVVQAERRRLARAV
jgi:hypothetical protein